MFQKIMKIFYFIVKSFEGEINKLLMRCYFKEVWVEEWFIFVQWNVVELNMGNNIQFVQRFRCFKMGSSCYLLIYVRFLVWGYLNCFCF